MSLSRKRRKELKALRTEAESLWHDQQVLLGRANVVSREAARQAAHLGREEVAPRARARYAASIQPRVDQGAQALRCGGNRLAEKAIPAVGTALGAALSAVDVAKDARVRTAVARLGRQPAPAQKSRGIGGFLAIGAGVIAVAGIGYAVWQTFRADDELWVTDEEPPATPADSGTAEKKTD